MPDTNNIHSELSSHELARIIDFLRNLRAPFDSNMPGARPDTFWNIVLELIDMDLHQRPLDKSSLILLSGLPYGTGNRMIDKMINNGLIDLVPRGAGLKTNYLIPSEELICSFCDYAIHVKKHLAKTFGLRDGVESSEYYFGGSYFASHIIDPLHGDDINNKNIGAMRFLLNNDNYFSSMRNMWSDFRNSISQKSSFELCLLPQLYSKAKKSFSEKKPEYDVVSINMPWLGEFAERGDLAPLDEILKDAAINPLDFHPTIWGAGKWKGVQYGIPIYCTTEILAIRKDLFNEQGVSFPRTFDETINIAKSFHDPDNKFYGIAWNAGRGMPIAHSFMFFLASARGSIMKISKPNMAGLSFYSDDALELTINNDLSLEVIDYMRRLVDVSPPGIESVDWEKRIQYFMSGQVAMTYCWTMRAARFEYELNSRVKRRVAYLPPPSLSGKHVSSPVGGFLLTIPSYISLGQRKCIIDAIAWMASPEAMKAHVKNGFPVAPRFSVCSDPEALDSSPIVSLVDGMARRNELVTWSRPPIKEYGLIERVLGEEIYSAIFEGKPARQALIDAESKIYRSTGKQ